MFHIIQQNVKTFGKALVNYRFFKLLSKDRQLIGKAMQKRTPSTHFPACVPHYSPRLK